MRNGFADVVARSGLRAAFSGADEGEEIAYTAEVMRAALTRARPTRRCAEIRRLLRDAAPLRDARHVEACPVCSTRALRARSLAALRDGDPWERGVGELLESLEPLIALFDAALDDFEAGRLEWGAWTRGALGPPLWPAPLRWPAALLLIDGDARWLESAVGALASRSIPLIVCHRAGLSQWPREPSDVARLVRLTGARIARAVRAVVDAPGREGILLLDEAHARRAVFCPADGLELDALAGREVELAAPAWALMEVACGRGVLRSEILYRDLGRGALEIDSYLLAPRPIEERLRLRCTSESAGRSALDRGGEQWMEGDVLGISLSASVNSRALFALLYRAPGEDWTLLSPTAGDTPQRVGLYQTPSGGYRLQVQLARPAGVQEWALVLLEPDEVWTGRDDVVDRFERGDLHALTWEVVVQIDDAGW